MSFREWWIGLGRGRQIGLGIGVVLILMLAAIGTYLVLRVPYVPLSALTDSQDNAAMVAQLEAMGADYRMDAESKRVLVPEDQRNALRLKLVERGLPVKAAAGFELFDNADFGMTEFSQKINYQRALEGELARTIMTLDSVRFARLHLVLPESTLFKRDREQPKASVTLVMLQDRTLTADQIAGIQRLVASAVPGLMPDAVSIHDHRGVNLVGADATGGPVSGRVKAKQTYESYLSDKIRGLLEPLFTGAHLAISVDATLRLDKVSTTREEVIPGGPARAKNLASKSQVVESLTRNADGSTALTSGSGVASSSGAMMDGDTRSSREVDQIEELPGATERLSIGVIVSSTAASNPTIDQIRDLIAGATGVDFSRGDRIAVYFVSPSGKTNATGEEMVGSSAADVGKLAANPHDPRSGEVMPNIPYLLLAAVALLVILLVASFARLFRRKAPASERLSIAEREAVLQKIRSWMQEDAAASGSARP